MYVAMKESLITPPYPCTLGGYERSSKSIGVLDDIVAETCVMKLHDNTLIFCTLDCICIKESFVQKLQKKVSTLYNIPQEHINIACIHTHSAPLFFALPTLPSDAETAYQPILHDALLYDIAYCMEHLEEVSVSFYEQSIEGFYGNRNQPEGNADKSFQAMLFHQGDTCKGIFAHIACHPTILDSRNLNISADVIGRIRSKMKDQYRVPVIIFNGACGDVSTRFYRKHQGDEQVEYVANGILQQVSLQGRISLSNLTIKIASFQFDTHFDATGDPWTNGQIKRLEADKLHSPQQFGKSENLLHRLLVKQTLGSFDLTLSSHIYVIDSIILVTIPGEIVSYAKTILKAKFPGYHIFIIAYCNGYASYLIDEDDYGKYFESFVAITPKGTFERLLKHIIKDIQALLE